MSETAESTTQVPPASPKAVMALLRQVMTRKMMIATTAASQMRSSAGAKAARFQGSSGPIAIANINGAQSGSTVWLKNGAPTESWIPNSRSAKGG